MKKWLVMLCAVLMLGTFGLAGCADSDKETLVVGIKSDFPPFEVFEDGSGCGVDQRIGFDIDMITAIAEKLDVKIKYKEMEFDTILAAIPNSVDIGVSGFTINEERKEMVSFSESYYICEQALVVKNTDTAYDNMTTKEEIDAELIKSSFNVGACNGYVGFFYMTDLREADEENPNGANIYSYSTFALACSALDNGSVNAIVMDKAVAEYYANQAGSKIKVIDVVLASEEYGIAMGKNNTALKEKIDNAIQELKAEGKFDEWIRKWMGTDAAA